MKALQLHYTSCRHGSSGSAGFQVRSATPGITPDEQREIERRCLYRPPRDAAPEPSQEEIERDFPRALRYYSLQSGRRALTRSSYTGRDYSGRWGNFFAHTLVLEEGVQPQRWPIDYYEWPHWKEGLAPGEDGDTAPPPLAGVDLASVAPAESFQLAELAEFLNEVPERRELLPRMGRALLLGRGDSRALVVRDTPVNNLFWIASLQKLFPPRHAANLSFSTYQEDPRDSAALNATSGQTGFTFSDTERRYQFYMFDLTTGVHSEVPAASADYPAMTARWLADNPNVLERFFAFMEWFRHDEVEEELLAALHLFELSRGQFFSLAGEQVSAMLRFATRWSTGVGKVELLEAVARGVDGGATERPADFVEVIRFLGDGARASSEPRHRALAFGAWLRLLDDAVVGRGQGLEEARHSGRELAQAFSPHAAELAGLLLAAERWSRWQPRLLSLPAEITTYLLQLTWRSLEEVGRLPPWEQAEVQTLMHAVLGRPGDTDRLVQVILAALPLTDEGLAAMSRVAAAAMQDAEPRSARLAVGRALGRVLAGAPPEVAAATRRHLDDEEGWDLLFGEWLELCGAAADLGATFKSYQQTVLAALPGYSGHRRSWVSSSILEHLSEKQALALVREWLQAGEVASFPPQLAQRCLDLANRHIGLDPDSAEDEELASLVAKEAARRQLVLRPDRPLLRRLLSRASEPALLTTSEIAALAPALDGIDARSYKAFLADFLEAALAQAGHRGEHSRLLEAIYRPEHTPAFHEAYRQFFRRTPKGRWPSSLQAALMFWIGFDASEPEVAALTALEAGACDELARALRRLPERRYQEIRGRMRRLGPAESERWQRIQEAVATADRGVFARLKGLVSRRNSAGPGI